MTTSAMASPRASALEVVDGGRSRTVQRSLERLVRDIREALGAEVALALYHGLGGEPHGRVLASSAEEDLALPLPNEPFWLGDWASLKRPQSRTDLVLTSALRPYQLELVSALVVPWSHTSGRGWLVAGVHPGAWNGGMLDLTSARNYASKLRQAHVLAGLRGATRLHREIAMAAQQLAEAEVTAPDTTALLESVALGARALLGTSAAYIALPDPDGNLAMSVHLNVRTASFRRLRLLANQGLGGLTNQRRTAVISPNYPEDRRLVDPPLTESLREGFLSAVCVPLIADDELVGLLYTANRHLTAFTETDAVLLQEFARYATLGLRRIEAERHRQAVLRRAEQERLAFQLHDSIVRTLIDIGYEAESGFRADDDPNLRHRLERIGQAAETCLDAIREQLASMTNPASSSAEIPVGDLLAAIDSSSVAATASRSVRTRGLSTWRLLPARVASALISIGQEALYNVDRHSKANQVDICVEINGTNVTLCIADDGAGIDEKLLPMLLDDTSGHLGLVRMRRAAADAGGTLSLGRSASGGLRVRATIPLN